MEFQSPLSVLSFLIIFCLFLFKLFKRSKLEKLPPGPWKLPLIGNLLQLACSNPIAHRALRDLANKHGPLMRLQLGEISAIVVSSPRVAKEILKTHDLSFADRPELIVGTILLANCRDIVLATCGDYWRQMRKICTMELLSANKVRTFRSIREDEAWNLIESIQLSLELPINLSEKVSHLTNAITCRATIGKRCKYQDELIKVVEDIVYWGSGLFMADMFPSLKFIPVISGMKSALKKLRQKLDYILENIIQEHKEKLESRKEGPVVDVEEEDLVDALMRINTSHRLEFPISHKDIEGIILDIFIAGTATTSAVLEWAMSELIKHPRVLEKAQAEVRLALKGNERIYEFDIEGLSYLKLVIKETLRLHAALILPRECRKECVIDGYTIPVKTKVIVNAWAIGRDPEYWVDAESFIPERFENSSVEYIGANFEYIPFGAGRRVCPGISFGIASIELSLAQLLYYFNWKLPNEMKPQDLDMDESSGATSKRRNHLFLIATSHTAGMSQVKQTAMEK